MLKCVAFDFGDTLVTTSDTIRKIEDKRLMFQLWKKYLPNMTEKEYLNSVGRADRRFKEMWGDNQKDVPGAYEKILLEELGREANVTHEDLWKGFLNIYIEHLTLMPNAMEILKFCKSRGLKLAVVSNATQESVKRKLIKFNLAVYFDTVVTSEEVGAQKSKLKPFHVLVERLKIRPEECLMVGDREDEDAYAKKVGMHTAIIQHPQSILDGEPEKADYYIKDLIELKPIIEKLMK